MNHAPAWRLCGGTTAALALGLALAGCGVVPRAPAPATEATLSMPVAEPAPGSISASAAEAAAAVPAAALDGVAEPAPAAEPGPATAPVEAPPQVGVASWYGQPFHGRRTANGERYDMHAMTAAHPSLPMRSWVLVRHLGNLREVVLRINDRGPFKWGRIIDLSRAAARMLGIAGVATVEVQRLAPDDVRVAALKAPPARRESRQAPPRELKPVVARARHEPDDTARRSVSASAARRPARSG